MILGLGIDIVENRRIESSCKRFGNRFIDRILNDVELNSARKISISYLASRFAAKEAAVKALGTGFSNGISFKDITIVSGKTGKPEIEFYAAAHDAFISLGATAAFVSISHGRDNSVATVILEG